MLDQGSDPLQLRKFPYTCTFGTYQKEWDTLFSEKFYLDSLKTFSCEGNLKNTHFRSVCWKLFLECLPEDTSLWIKTATSQRQNYEKILDKFYIDPRAVHDCDLEVNNPLSQCQQSSWNQYFQDKELKAVIEQDVVRTFPEVEFFHTKEIQTMMSSILFSYAREFPHMSYKQGMHEILAPILFVLSYDQQTFEHVAESEELRLDIRTILNRNYIEHDAFIMFCQIMEVMAPWYTTDSPTSPNCPDMLSFDSNGNSLGRKLNKIFTVLLNQHDEELYSYLDKLEISPQIFGIRWLRLLFGREFSIHDLLIIWDVIFADSPTFQIVDYIFISMLSAIRVLLINEDYATCLSYLMRYPNLLDVQEVINIAFQFKQTQNTLSERTTSNHPNSVPGSMTGCSKQASNLFSARNGKLLGTANPSRNRPKSLSIPIMKIFKMQQPGITESVTNTRTKSSSMSEKVKTLTIQDKKDSESLYMNYQDFTCPSSQSENENRSQSNQEKELVLLDKAYLESQKQLEFNTYDEDIELAALKIAKELHERKLMNEYCSREISEHLLKLQECMTKQKLCHENEILFSLAGLKKARDILNGTVSFTKKVLGKEFESFPSIMSSENIGESIICKSCLAKQTDVSNTDVIVVEDFIHDTNELDVNTKNTSFTMNHSTEDNLLYLNSSKDNDVSKH